MTRAAWLLLLVVCMGCTSHPAPVASAPNDWVPPNYGVGAEFLLLREGICRTGTLIQHAPDLIVVDLKTIPCPKEELQEYLR